MEYLSEFFSYVCGQQHCWVLDGETLPFCQRCTGLYAGACFALVLVLLFRPMPGALTYWIHGAFMLAMFPFGFHLLEHGGLVRTFTGALFSSGLVYYLALNPLSAWNAWKKVDRLRTAVYLSSIGAAIAFLLLAVNFGGAKSAVVLAGLGVIGFAALSILTVLNLIVLPGILRQLLFRSLPSHR